MKLTLPYEITKLFDIKIDPLTGERKISLKRNYAFPIEENFKTIKKYFSDLISGENLTSLAKKNIIHLLPQDAVLPTSNSPALTKNTGTYHTYYTLDFDKDADEQCFWHFTIPANWESGNITVYIKYIANATSGVVRWSIHFVGIAESENIDRIYTFGKAYADTVDATANQLCIASETPNLSLCNPKEWIVFKFLRNGSHSADTLTVDARLLEVVIEWNLK